MSALKKLFNFSALSIATLVVVFNLAFFHTAFADNTTPSVDPTPSPSATTSTNPQPSATPNSTPVATPITSPDPSSTPTSTPSPVPTATPQPSTSPVDPIATQSAIPTSSPTPQPTSNPSTDTTQPGNLELNREYAVPGSSNSKIKFTNLPAGTNNFSFTTSTLDSQQVSRLGALDSTVYEFTSNMTNGTFTYDLTLPLPIGVSGTNFKVFYAHDVNGLSSPIQVTESITNNGDGTFTIHNLNHFTVFVVVNPNSQANCDAVTIGTTPGSTCYTTVQAAVNAASNGDTITIDSNGSPYHETVYVNKQLTINGNNNPSVDSFVLQTTPVSISGIITSVSIATPTNVSLTNPVHSGNQNNVTISGNGAANATVNYTITDSSSNSITGTGTVDSAGNINLTGIDVSSLNEGVLTTSLYLTNGTYFSSTVNASSFKDTIAPASPSNLSITNPINNSNKTNVSFSGNGEAGSTANYTITDGTNTLSGTTIVNGSGAFSVSAQDLSFLNDGTITFSVTLTDTAGNTSSNTSITAVKDTVAPTVNVGSNQVKRSSFTTSATASDQAPSPGIATYAWTQTAGPGVITFGTPNALNTTVSANADGTYTLQLTVTDGANNTSSSSFNLVWDTVAPTVSVLTNATTNTQFTRTATVTDSSPTSGIASTTWSQISGPGTISFGSVNSTTTTISANQDGTYVVSFTAIDNAGNSSSQSFTLIWDTVQPTVNAGSNVVTNLGFTTSAIVSDPTPSSGIATYAWSQISGPGTITFSAPNALVSNVTADTDGTYTIQLTVTDNAGNSNSSTFTLIWDTIAPSVSAGSNKITNSLFTTTATVVDAAPSSGVASYSWTQISGPGTITFGSANTLNTTVSANQDGTYVVQLTSTDNAGNSSSSQFSLVWDTVAPIVSAGVNHVTNASFTQTGTASDAAPSSGGLTYQWTQTGGPGQVTFGSANSLITTVSANQDGVYTLTLSVTDAAGNIGTSSFTLTWDQTAPVVSAGPNTNTNGNNFQQIGTATDNLSGIASTNWTKISGPGNVIFSNPNSLVTQINMSAGGTYQIQLSATDNAGNSSSSIASIFYGPNNSNGSSNSSSNSSPSAPSAPSCGDEKPGSAPFLRISKIAGDKIILTWEKAKDPVTYYLVEYGLSSGHYQFGVPNIGNVTSFEIGGLQTGITYYFRVRAGNGCTPGDFSNEVFGKAGQVGFATQIIHVASSALGVKDAFAAEKQTPAVAGASGDIATPSNPTETPSETNAATTHPFSTQNPKSGGISGLRSIFNYILQLLHKI